MAGARDFHVGGAAEFSPWRHGARVSPAPAGCARRRGADCRVNGESLLIAVLSEPEAPPVRRKHRRGWGLPLLTCGGSTAGEKALAASQHPGLVRSHLPSRLQFRSGDYHPRNSPARKWKFPPNLASVATRISFDGNAYGITPAGSARRDAPAQSGTIHG